MRRAVGYVVALAAAITIGSCDDGRQNVQPASKCAPGCTGAQVCVEALGCVDCVPGQPLCAAPDRTATCDATGHFMAGETCDAATRQACDAGQCVDACVAAANRRSNVGCEYWPVDLPQFCDQANAFICERDQDFAVLVTNLNAFSVHVVVERSDAAVGSPAAPVVVLERDVASRGVEVLKLPQREVDGSNNTDPENLSGITARAYHLTSNGPVVAYQLNTLTETDSIDASLLIPTASLEGRYRAITTPSIVLDTGAIQTRNRAFVTIVGTAPNTHVHVTAGGHIVGGGGVVDTTKGGGIDAVLGPYEVLHLAGTTTGGLLSSPGEGDLSTTFVEADNPVAVFSGHVCSTVIGPMDSPQPPGGSDGCCCDHLEEQVPPTTALGAKFAVTRSPQRSTSVYVEPDIYRILADKPDTIVTTNLAPPWDNFYVGPDQIVEFWAQKDFVLTATGPVLLAQLLVGANWGAGTGDPSLTYLPPNDQWREDYVFLVPETYDRNFVVVGREVGVEVRIDGKVAGKDLTSCTVHPIGMIEMQAYESVRCQLTAGPHALDADRPVSLIEYGYGDTGSIAYVGGTDYKIINPVL